VPDVPKPLAPIAGKPFLQYLIEQWVRQGAARIGFLLHHQAELVERFLEEVRGQDWLAGRELWSVREPRPLGTGGAVAFAVRSRGLEDDFLVTNADTWLGGGLQAVAGSRTPAIGVIHVTDSGRYGAVRVADRVRVEAFEEKRGDAGAGWINAGLYHLHPRLFRHWNGEPLSLERDVFPALVATEGLGAVPLVTEFIDIGIPADYFRFCRWIEAGKSGSL
jgi:NDP-sugar pyrophosphorylase family protein